MSPYLRALQREHAAEVESRQAERERAAATARYRLTPLDERLKRLLQDIPMAVQIEGLSLMALQAQPRARVRGHMHCHIGELGETLRKSGFRR